MIAGNFEDKYNTKNPISKILVSEFIKTFNNLLNEINRPTTIADIGTGEGYLTKILSKKFAESSIIGSDISEEIITIAQKIADDNNIKFEVQNVENLSYKNNSFNLVVCCEVMEHVKKPIQAFSEIHRVTKDNVIVSVPQEPVWRILNMVRFKYLKRYGNTPGHVNHWSRKDFKKLIYESGFEIVSNKNPLPWQMYLLKKV